MRAISLATAAAVLAGSLVAPISPRRTAGACLLPPHSLDRTAVDLEVLFIGVVAEVGPSYNEQPPLPSPTPTSTLTPQPNGADDEGQGARTSPAPTERPSPTPTPWPTPDLAGYRARLAVAQAFIGDPPPIVDVDVAARVLYEQALREDEAKARPPERACPAPPPSARYATGSTYLVAAAMHGADVTTVQAWPVDGDDVLNVPGALSMPLSLYQRHFAGIDADIIEEWSMLTAPRVPVASVVAAILDVRGESQQPPPNDAPRTVRLPSTGNAGLAATR